MMSCWTCTLLAILCVNVALILFPSCPPLSCYIRDWQRAGNFLRYNEHKIFYRDVAGSGWGTLICLHGFPTFSWDWSKILPGLQTKFSRIILLDFLGCGLSDKPVFHQYSIYEQADIVTSLAMVLGVKSTHLLSHDYGDTVAQELVYRHNHKFGGKVMKTTVPAVSPLTVQSLVMLNGGVLPEAHKPHVQEKLLIPFIERWLTLLTVWDLFKRRFAGIFGDNQPSEEEFQAFYSAVCHKGGLLGTVSPLEYIAECRANRKRWVGALKESEVPVMMIYGPADPVNPPEFVELFRKELPQHKLVVLDKGIGHYPQWEDPQSVLQSIAEFQDAQDSSIGNVVRIASQLWSACPKNENKEAVERGFRSMFFYTCCL